MIPKTINGETAKDPKTTKCDASKETVGNLKNQITVVPSNRKRNQNKATIYNEASKKDKETDILLNCL